MYIGSDLDNCPPQEAKSIPGEYFRFVVSSLDNAFKSRFELGLHQSDSCEERAISLMLSRAAVEKKRIKYKAFKNAKLAILQITSEHGIILIDKPEIHANWWHPIGFDPATIASLEK